MRTNILLYAALLGVLISLPAPAGAQEESAFGNRLRCSQYAGASVMIPKDKDFDAGMGLLYGVKWRNRNEEVFLDLTLAQTRASNSILWFSGDVRHTIVRLGYKRPVTRNRRLLAGADIQTQRMDFGSRQITGVSIGALAEYKVTSNWSVQLESSQKTKRSGIYYGNFTLAFLKTF